MQPLSTFSVWSTMHFPVRPRYFTNLTFKLNIYKWGVLNNFWCAVWSSEGRLAMTWGNYEIALWREITLRTCFWYGCDGLVWMSLVHTYIQIYTKSKLWQILLSWSWFVTRWEWSTLWSSCAHDAAQQWVLARVKIMVRVRVVVAKDKRIMVAINNSNVYTTTYIHIWYVDAGLHCIF